MVFLHLCGFVRFQSKGWTHDFGREASGAGALVLEAWFGLGLKLYGTLGFEFWSWDIEKYANASISCFDIVF